jgi:glycosidase
LPKIELSRWIFLEMLTWGKLLGLAAEIHAQPRAEPGANASPLELVRTPVSSEVKGFAMDLSPFSPMAPVDTFLPQPSPHQARHEGPAYDLLSLRIDPSQVRRAVALAEEAVPLRPEHADADVRAIDQTFTAKSDPKNRFLELTRFVTQEDLEEAKRLARLIHPSRWSEIYVRFADELLKTEYARDQELRRRDSELAHDWHRAPWYILDPRSFFVPEGTTTSTFADVEKGLDWVRHLGFDNLALKSHYDADSLDTGASVTALSPSTVLGGEPAFQAMMARANVLGLRVVTSAPFAYTSIHHPWFMEALGGDDRHLAYYASGDARDPDTLIAGIGEREVRFKVGRRPFQAALDLSNPELLGSLLHLLGREANLGSLGRIAERADAWSHAHPVLGLMKLFLALIGPRQIVIPEVALDAEAAAAFAGHRTQIQRVPTSSEGDVFLWLDAARALQESLALEDKLPIETAIDRMPALPPTVTPAVLLEHPSLGSRNGTVHKGDPHRIALSIACLYMMPATPVLSAGSEIGAEDDEAHAEYMAERQAQYLEQLGAPVPKDLAHDPVLRHEGALPSRELRRAAQGRYLPLETIRALNALAKKHPALLSRSIARIENTHKGVLSWVKLPERDADAPLLLLANLSTHTARLSLPVEDLRRALQIAKDRPLQLSDLLSKSAQKTAHRISLGKVLITIPPSGFVVLTSSFEPSPGSRA